MPPEPDPEKKQSKTATIDTALFTHTATKQPSPAILATGNSQDP
jgi:hypothetical protein